jgi:hypothetical protein
MDKKYTTEAEKIPNRANTQNSNNSTKGDYKPTSVKESGDVLDADSVMSDKKKDRAAL